MAPVLLSALRFYTDFANPSRPVYSWNLSLPQDKTAFLSGKTAIYFGFASELKELRDKNPNLNFDVTFFPQLRDSKTRITFGSIEGFGVLRSSPNIAAAFNFLNKLSGAESAGLWAKATLLPPARRDLLATKPTDAYLSIFYDSALWARGWLDPDVNQTRSIFSSMIQAVSSGKFSYVEALSNTSERLQNILNSLP